MVEEIRGLPPVDSMMEEGIERGVFPGAVLLVARGGEVIHHRAMGRRITTPFSAPLHLSTLFDLSSLTKPLATVFATMILFQRGLLSLEERISSLIPEFEGGGREEVEVHHLLNHSSGLAWWRPYYLDLWRRGEPFDPQGQKERLFEKVFSEPLLSSPGTREEYSDIGFMISGRVVERVSGMEIHEFLDREITGPLALSSTYFPGVRSPEDAIRMEGDFAATEACPWRGNVVCGAVHDENAFCAGGRMGHSGLFSTSFEVYGMAAELLDSWNGSGRLLNGETMRRFWLPGKERFNRRWSMGFDTPTGERSSAGIGASSMTFGHLGFTGCSFWIDAEREMIIVFLTNRVHPFRGNDRIKGFRHLLHSAIYEAV